MIRVKKTIVALFMGVVFTTLPLHGSAENQHQYFEEFGIPLEIVADPAFERVEILRDGQFLSLNYGFGVPLQLVSIIKHEYDIWEFQNRAYTLPELAYYGSKKRNE